MKNLFLFIALFLFAANPVLSQVTIHVPGDYSTIQAGIDAAQNGDIVLVDDGTYVENINFSGKAITVASHFLVDSLESHIENTIIDGSQPTHPDSSSVVTFNSGEDTTSILCGFTITGGTGTFVPANPPSSPVPFRFGGGILCSMSGAIIKNNIIKNNECIINLIDAHAAGGGICSEPPGYNSIVVIDSNQIINNLVWAQGNITVERGAWAQGGGVAFYSDGLVINNEISSNHCESIYGYGVGGGIRLLGGTTKILNNNIDLNSSISINSEGFAGGISCSWANTVIDSNNITNNFVAGVSFCKGAAIFFDLDNDAYWAVVKNNYISGNYHTNGICYGGAIGMGKSSPDIYNNVITNNSANYGGALSAVVNSKPIIINNTIVSNTASNVGGGIYSNQSTLAVLNSIIWNNSAPAGPQIYGSDDVQYSDVEGGYTGIGNIDIYPEFVDMVNENYHLSDNSPFIGAGIDSLEIGGIWYYAPSCDFDGNPRPNPDITKPDMGAYENPREVPLPVELTSFTAITQIGKVILNWSTATEINNLGFEIERKIISSETNRDWLLLALEKDMEQQQNQENILLWMI